MSAGRCTRGLYGSLFRSEFKNAENILVLDSEGLLAIEKNDESYDKKLATFALTLSHITIINVNGEINESMKKILSIALYAAK
jgi:hypothetical protein